MSDAVRLYLVRHGATADLEAGRLQGQRRDGGLSALGVAQVRQLAQHVPASENAAIYSSDLKRAAETAAILADAVGGAPVRYDVRLRELDFGAWEGLTLPELRAAYPDESITPFIVPHAVSRYGGEHIDSLRKRVTAVYSELRAAGRSAVVVAHAHTLSALLCAALDLPVRDQWYFGLDPASISTLLIWPDAPAFLLRLNQIERLQSQEGVAGRI